LVYHLTAQFVADHPPPTTSVKVLHVLDNYLFIKIHAILRTNKLAVFQT